MYSWLCRKCSKTGKFFGWLIFHIWPIFEIGFTASHWFTFIHFQAETCGFSTVPEACNPRRCQGTRCDIDHNEQLQCFELSTSINLTSQEYIDVHCEAVQLLRWVSWSHQSPGIKFSKPWVMRVVTCFHDFWKALFDREYHFRRFLKDHLWLADAKFCAHIFGGLKRACAQQTSMPLVIQEQRRWLFYDAYARVCMALGWGNSSKHAGFAVPHLGPGINQMLQALSYYIVGSIAEEAPFAQKAGKERRCVFPRLLGFENVSKILDVTESALCRPHLVLLCRCWVFKFCLKLSFSVEDLGVVCIFGLKFRSLLLLRLDMAEGSWLRAKLLSNYRNRNIIRIIFFHILRMNSQTPSLWSGLHAPTQLSDCVQNAFMSPNEANDSYDTATMISFHRWLSQSHISFLWIRHVCQWFCCHSTGMQQWSAVFAVSGTQASLATSVPKTLAFANSRCFLGICGIWMWIHRYSCSSKDCVHGISSIVHWKLDCNCQSFNMHIITH